MDRRLRLISDAITYDVFCYIWLGLFERHKLLFSFHVATRLALTSGLIDYKSLQFFLQGSQSLTSHAKPKPQPWLSDKVNAFLKRTPATVPHYMM